MFSSQINFNTVELMYELRMKTDQYEFRHNRVTTDHCLYFHHTLENNWDYDEGHITYL